MTMYEPDSAEMAYDDRKAVEEYLNRWLAGWNARQAYVKQFGIVDKRPWATRCDRCGAEIHAGVPSAYFPYGEVGKQWACPDCARIDLRLEAAV